MPLPCISVLISLHQIATLNRFHRIAKSIDFVY